MLTAVNLDSKSMLCAEEIENERPELMLTTKFRPGDLPTSEQNPEQPLGVSLFTPKLTASCEQIRSRLTATVVVSHHERHLRTWAPRGPEEPSPRPSPRGRGSIRRPARPPAPSPRPAS